MAPDGNLNLNTADCLRNVSDIGVTHVHNICNGAIIDVPWGTSDWVLCAGFSAGGLAVLCVFFSMARAFWNDR